MNDNNFREYMSLFAQFTQHQNEQKTLENTQLNKAWSYRKQRNNDPYGVDLASKKDKGFPSHRKIQNRFKLIKKQNLET